MVSSQSYIEVFNIKKFTLLSKWIKRVEASGKYYFYKFLQNHARRHLKTISKGRLQKIRL